MKNVKVILWGLGAMGGGIGKMLTKKTGRRYRWCDRYRRQDRQELI